MTNLCLGSFLLLHFLLASALGNQSLTPYCQNRQQCLFFFKFNYFVVVLTGSCYVAQAGFKFIILLP
jgi:hypothetical protein